MGLIGMRHQTDFSQMVSKNQVCFTSHMTIFSGETNDSSSSHVFGVSPVQILLAESLKKC